MLPANMQSFPQKIVGVHLVAMTITPVVLIGDFNLT